MGGRGDAEKHNRMNRTGSLCYNPRKMLVDTHAHLTMPEFAPDLPAVLERAAAAGVFAIVCVGIDLSSSREAVELSSRHQGVVATVGVHPNDSGQLPSGWLEELRALLAEPEVVAVGEIGLDYYRKRVAKDRQREVFQAQLDLAGELGLPVVIHNRGAGADLAEMLMKWVEGLSAQHPRGVLHCFSGDLSMMRSCCAAGFCVSFAGPVTYPNSENATEMVAAAPRDCLLLETDSPFLSPQPYRGKRNEPANVRLVAERVATLRGEGLDAVMQFTGQNAERLFGLKARSTFLRSRE